MRSLRVPLVVSLSAIIFAAILLIAGCGGSDSPSGNKGGSGDLSLSLDGAMTGVQLLSGQTTEVTFNLYPPPGTSKLDSVEIDMLASLPHLIIPTLKRNPSLDGLYKLLIDTGTVTATVRVSDDPSTVCSEGFVYGPYTISSTSVNGPSTGTIPLDPSTVQLLNNGGLSICVELYSTVDLEFSLDQIETNVIQSGCDDAVNFAGVWKGTFECGNSCGGSFGDSIQITVTQDGTTATYIDPIGTVYAGNVCGNQFRFQSVNTDTETESGTLTLISPGFAVKRSTWRSLDPPYCGGDCLDSLYLAVAYKPQAE